MTRARLTTPIRRLTPVLALVAALAAPRAAAPQGTSTDSARRAGTDTTARRTTPDTTARQTTTDTTARQTTRLTNASGSRTDSVAAAGPRVDSLLTATAHMGHRIRLQTKGVDAWATGANDPKKLVLYLDGRAMHGAVAQRVSAAGQPEQWEVRLRRSSEGRDAWEAALGSPDSLVSHVRVGLGPAAGPEFATPADVQRVTLGLEVARPWWLLFSVLAWLALIWGLVHLARTTGVIRDSPAPVPPPPGDAPAALRTAGNPLFAAREARKVRLALRPYSMARTQMAFWFVLVTSAYLAIWMITGDAYGVITTQALFLIGLGAGTALAAGVTESNGRKEQAAAAPSMVALDAQWQTLAVQKADFAPAATAVGGAASIAGATPAMAAVDVQMQQVEATRAAVAPDAPVSKGFFHDILTEKDEPALHRYQHFVWTLIIGAVFVAGAYQTLALPELDSTMLLLMGISAATYVGFKTRENQT